MQNEEFQCLFVLLLLQGCTVLPAVVAQMANGKVAEAEPSVFMLNDETKSSAPAMPSGDSRGTTDIPPAKRLLIPIPLPSPITKPIAPVKVHVWAHANSTSFRYPETSQSMWSVPRLMRNPDLGIALSGGGLRAAALADGWMRGFHMVRELQVVTGTMLVDFFSISSAMVHEWL